MMIVRTHALQGLNGKLIPASTPEQPLPRVLALPPGTHLEAASWEEYRCSGGSERQHVLHAYMRSLHPAELLRRGQALQTTPLQAPALCISGMRQLDASGSNAEAEPAG